MDTGRVGACHRLENKRRKFLIVINDVVKNKYDVTTNYLDHSYEEIASRLEKSKMFVRRALVRQKVLQKCMKMRRTEKPANSVFGRYEGKPVEAFGKDIEKFIAFNHPKMRRQRYLQKLMNESLEKGAILQETIAQQRVSNWLERSYTKPKLDLVDRNKPASTDPPTELRDRRSKLPKLPKVGGASFYIQSSVTSDDVTETGDVNVLKVTHKRDSITPKTPESRGRLVLPPINPDRSHVSTRAT